MVRNYQLKGDEAWQELWPCSAFAMDIWLGVTGEYLNDKHMGFFYSDPNVLSRSIINKNKGRTNYYPDYIIW